MTTIAIKDFRVAYDGNSTHEGMTVITNKEKLIVDNTNKFICFHAGHVESQDDFLDIYIEHKNEWHKNFTYTKKTKSKNYDSVAFIVVNYSVGNISILDFFPTTNGDKEILRYSNMILSFDTVYAIGSGRQFAYGAMDHGSSAKEAVEIAAQRDPYTGGKITEIDLIEFGKNIFNKQLDKPNKIRYT